MQIVKVNMSILGISKEMNFNRFSILFNNVKDEIKKDKEKQEYTWKVLLVIYNKMLKKYLH